MSKCSLTLAAVSLALMSAGAAAQGLSYESRGYGGPLYIGPNFQQGGQHAPPVYGSGQERSNSVERYRAPQRIDRVQRRRNTDDDDVKTAKKTPVKEESKEAKAEPENKAKNESSSIAAVDSGKDKAVTTPVTPKTDTAKSDASKSSNENSTIASVASTSTAKAQPVKTSVTKVDTDGSGKPTGCKRYFPTIGQTLSVPCD